METHDYITTTNFTIDLASALSLHCGGRECIVDDGLCPFGYDSVESKLCLKVTPSMWVKVLKERVG